MADSEDRDIVGVLKGDGWTATLTRSKGWAVEGDSQDLDMVKAICAAHEPGYYRAVHDPIDPLAWGVSACLACAKVLRVSAKINPAHTRDTQGSTHRQKQKPKAQEAEGAGEAEETED